MYKPFAYFTPKRNNNNNDEWGHFSLHTNMFCLIRPNANELPITAVRIPDGLKVNLT